MKLPVVLILLFVIGCSQPNQTLPKLINTNKDFKRIRLLADEIQESYPIFLGKFNKKQREIDLENFSLSTSDYLEHPNFNEPENFPSQDLKLIIDYNQTVYYNYLYYCDSNLVAHYPLFIINETQKSQFISGKDGHLFGIQEVKHYQDTNVWHPIEAQGYDFCGNGYWMLELKPNEYAVALLKKYAGNYKTKIRTRIEFIDTIILSEEYYGIVDSNQIFLSDSSVIRKRLIRSEGRRNKQLFYDNPISDEKWKK